VTLRFRRYAFAQGVELGLSGSDRVVRHFDSEYRPGKNATGGGLPVAEIAFDGTPRSADATIAGGYKTARWRVFLGDPAREPLRAVISLRGRPVGFGLSLVQGFFVEPLLSVGSARRHRVLVPGAAVVEPGGALLLLGRSRSGKSTLAARAAAAGRRVLGDDQVILDPGGGCSAFPRRMRFYSDLPRTAPRAFARLPAGTRAALVGRRIVSAATRGYVAPPVRIEPGVLGVPFAVAAEPVARVVLVERSDDADRLRCEAGDLSEAVGWALRLLDEQRMRLRGAGGPWRRAVAVARSTEQSVLHQALADAPVERIRVPRNWDAARAVAALADHLRIEE
jgi:hypothetical protein